MTVAVFDSSYPHGFDSATKSQSPANAAKNFTKCQTRLHQSGFLCVQSTPFSKHILFLFEGSGFVCKSPSFVKLTAVETTSSTTLHLSILSQGLKLFVSSFNLCVCMSFTISQNTQGFSKVILKQQSCPKRPQSSSPNNPF